MTLLPSYLWAVAEEARARGYRFDTSKITARKRRVSMAVTLGQLEYERAHLNRKLRVRDPSKLHSLSGSKLQPHPMLRVVAGDIERWERRPHGR